MPRGSPTTRAGAKPTLVLFVRHGLTATTGKKLPGRARRLHLAEEGRRQAEADARRLRRVDRIAAVYASPLERARETAQAIAEARGLRVRIEPALSDLDVGEWTGRSLGRLRRRREWPVIQRHPSGFRFPGGESFTEMQARMVSAVERLCARHPGATIVVVSHADPIKAVLSHALGAHLDLFQRIAIAPGSVSAVAYRGLGPTVLALNAADGDAGWLGPR
jgi:probable phosphoglycerate mutase